MYVCLYASMHACVKQKYEKKKKITQTQNYLTNSAHTQVTQAHTIAAIAGGMCALFLSPLHSRFCIWLDLTLTFVLFTYVCMCACIQASMHV